MPRNVFKLCLLTGNGDCNVLLMLRAAPMVIVPGKLKGSGFMETSVNIADDPPQFFHIKLFTLTFLF